MKTTTGTYGYDQLKKLAAFGVAFSLSFKGALAAPSHLGKAAAFLTSLDEAAGLLSLDPAQAQAEFEDMSDEEWLALTREIAEEFALEHGDPAFDGKIEKSIDLAFNILQAVREGAALWGHEGAA